MIHKFGSNATIMNHARISRLVYCSTSKRSAEDNTECKLLKSHGITSIAQLKINKLARSEIVEKKRSDWFTRDHPTVSHNNSKLTLHLCPFTMCKFQGNTKQMRRHKFQSHPTIMPYKCEVSGCKYVSNQHALLIHHMKQSHKILRPQFVCSYSGCDFKARYKTNYKNHLIKVHDQKHYACETCGKAFKTMQNLKCHLMTHTQEKPYKCPHCAWSGRQAAHLKLHLQLHEDPSTRAKFRIYKCTFEDCKYWSNISSHLKRHITRHSKDKSFKCSWPKCYAATCSKSRLNQHMKIHSKDKRYICNFCSSTYTTYGGLLIHIRSHTGEKPYKCSYQNCEYAAAESRAVKNHEQARHSDEIRKRSFTCALCQKSFSEKHVVESHMRIHTGERPYSCQYCARGFTGSGARNVHERRCKMRPDGKIIKPFGCQFCERAFVTKASKRLHELCCKMRDDGKIIKPHKCQYCLKEFTQKGTLKCHKMCCRSRPDGIIIKPFKCLFRNCKFAATCRSYFKRHTKIHLLVE